jgi:hypothetical protein
VAKHDARRCCSPLRVSCLLHAALATLTQRTVSSATGLDGVDLIEYDIIYDMCFVVSIFSARSNALVEVCCQGKTYP